jgi:protease-4
VATGQVFNTKQALASGLVDRQGFLEDAIERAAELAGLDVKNTQCVRYGRPATLADVVLGSVEARREPTGAELATALVGVRPQAYYLWNVPAALVEAQRGPTR